jgi:uncharacterized protein (TIGR03663 family)
MTTRSFRGLLLCAVVGALLLRVIRLDLRPMHHDEANQAVKFGDLLERGEYRFDPNNHHGPTLYYLTLPAAWAAGARSLAGLDETTVRIVPALFGAGLLLLLLLFSGGLSREATLAAAALAGVSPVMTYYSRFYIQETLLVFFLAGLIGLGWIYSKKRSGPWALAAGVAAGLMYATKETSVLLFAGLAGAAVISALLDQLLHGRGKVVTDGDSWVWSTAAAKLPKGFHIVLFLAAGALAAGLFYTSFLRNPEGLADSVRALGASFRRASQPGVHAHPWYFYFQTLAYSRAAGGPIWSEAFLLFLAAVGALAVFGREGGRGDNPRFLRFVLFFTLLTAALYSLIPYKTPWNLLPFYLGLVVLAGNGVGLLLRLSRLRPIKILILGLLAPGFVNLALQSYRASFKLSADPANPYVYAQTSPDLLKLVGAVEAAAARSPEKRDLLIEVIAPPDETWPLPWYLRKYGRVGYWASLKTATKDVPAGKASVVITASSFAGETAAKLGEAYEQTFYGLRPEVVLSLFVRRVP